MGSNHYLRCATYQAALKLSKFLLATFFILLFERAPVRAEPLSDAEIGATIKEINKLRADVKVPLHPLKATIPLAIVSHYHSLDMPQVNESTRRLCTSDEMTRHDNSFDNQRIAEALSRGLTCSNVFGTVPLSLTYRRDRFLISNYYLLLGENVGWGPLSGSEIFNAWKNSPGHYAPMVSGSNQGIGVSVIRRQYSNSWWTGWWTANFGGVPTDINKMPPALSEGTGTIAKNGGFETAISTCDGLMSDNLNKWCVTAGSTDRIARSTGDSNIYFLRAVDPAVGGLVVSQLMPAAADVQYGLNEVVPDSRLAPLYYGVQTSVRRLSTPGEKCPRCIQNLRLYFLGINQDRSLRLLGSKSIPTGLSDSWTNISIPETRAPAGTKYIKVALEGSSSAGQASTYLYDNVRVTSKFPAVGNASFELPSFELNIPWRLVTGGWEINPNNNDYFFADLHKWYLYGDWRRRTLLSPTSVPSNCRDASSNNDIGCSKYNEIYYIRSTNGNNGTNSAAQIIPGAPGVTYTLSARVKKVSGRGLQNLHLDFLDVNGKQVGTRSYASCGTSTSWKQISTSTVTAPAGTRYVRIFIYRSEGSPQESVYDFDDVRVTTSD